jgi:hypothetical protein
MHDRTAFGSDFVDTGGTSTTSQTTFTYDAKDVLQSVSVTAAHTNAMDAFGN